MKTYVIMSTLEIFASFNWQKTKQRKAIQGPSPQLMADGGKPPETALSPLFFKQKPLILELIHQD